MALTSAFAGWYARHHMAKDQIAAAKALADSLNNKL